MCGGMGAVGGVGVGNAEIFMVAAMGIPVVDGVAAFWGFAVAFKLFVANRAKAECDGIGFQQVALRIVGIISRSALRTTSLAISLPGGRAGCCNRLCCLGLRPALLPMLGRLPGGLLLCRRKT